MPHLLAVFLGHSGHPGDDLDRERSGEVLDDVEVIGIGLAQVLVDQLNDRLFLRLDGPRGERLVEQAAHVPVVGWVHEDDRLLRNITGSHHRQVATARRRVAFEVLERGSHVLMASQGVEVFLLVVIKRRVLPHPSIYVERVLVVLLGERIENDLRFCHCVLLGGDGRMRAGTVTTECSTVMLTVAVSTRTEKMQEESAQLRCIRLSSGVPHQVQRGVGRVEYRPALRPGLIGQVDDQPNILLQQRSRHAGKVLQAADPAEGV